MCCWTDASFITCSKNVVLCLHIIACSRTVIYVYGLDTDCLLGQSFTEHFVSSPPPTCFFFFFKPDYLTKISASWVGSRRLGNPLFEGGDS